MPTKPPAKSETLAVAEFERALRTYGEVQARLQNLQRAVEAQKTESK